MNVRALCAAAVVAVGVGQAEAATVTHKVIFTVTEAVDTYYPVYDGGPSDAPNVDTHRDGFWGLETGKPTRGTLTVSDDCLGFGCPLVKLVVAGTTLYDDVAEGVLNSFEGIQGFSGYKWEYIKWNGSSGIFQHIYDATPTVTFAEASMTLAPVPLPATAALLPLGVGALAMMRKRRRSIQTA